MLYKRILILVGLTNQTTRKKLSAERLHQILAPWDPNDHQKTLQKSHHEKHVFSGSLQNGCLDIENP